MNTIINLI